MSKELKHRMERIEERVSPPKYLTIEDKLRVIHLRRQKTLTPQETRILEELEGLPSSPTVEKALLGNLRRRETDKPNL